MSLVPLHQLSMRIRYGWRAAIGARCGPFHIAALVAAVLLAAASITTSVHAQTAQFSFQPQQCGFIVQLPNNPVASATLPGRSGLQMEVTNRWVNNFGYRPIHITVTSPKPTTADHVVTIRLHVATWNWGKGSVVVEQDIVMPKGSMSVQAVIASPHFPSNNRYWWDVWVDDVKDRSLCVDESTGWQFSSNSYSSANTTRKFLILDVPANSYRITGPGPDLFEALALTPLDLPERWIEYTCFDAIALSPSELQTLADIRPKALRAISRWVRSGGQLWISPVGSKWQKLSEVERLLEMSPESDEETNDGTSDADVAARGWRPIMMERAIDTNEGVLFLHLPSQRTELVEDQATIALRRRDPNWIVTHEAHSPIANDDEPQAGDEVEPQDSGKWYVQRQHGLGYVRIFRRTWDPVGFGFSWRMLMGTGPPDPSAPPTPLSMALETTKNWEARHGMTPESANLDFANLLVPGVGQAPVTEFRVLITAFVVLIGPLNYWYFKRTHRLHMLVLTVPAVAAALTVGLFAYALASDGLGTKVRVRSLMTLDGQTGEAACWARLSYYAGLAPSQGLVMPDDLVIYPILPVWHEAGGPSSRGAERQMTWTNDEGHYAQGWLRSRIPTQYLSVRARKSPCQLQLRSTGERLIATNKLRTNIQFMAAIDDSDKYFSGQDIADGVTVALQPIDRAKFLLQLRKLVMDAEPEMPPELADDFSPFFAWQRSQYQYRFGTDSGTARLNESILDTTIHSLSGLNERELFELPPRSYVAITDTGPEVVTGVADAVEEESFHVVIGNW